MCVSNWSLVEDGRDLRVKTEYCFMLNRFTIVCVCTLAGYCRGGADQVAVVAVKVLVADVRERDWCRSSQAIRPRSMRYKTLRGIFGGPKSAAYRDYVGFPVRVLMTTLQNLPV